MMILWAWIILRHLDAQELRWLILLDVMLGVEAISIFLWLGGK